MKNVIEGLIFVFWLYYLFILFRKMILPVKDKWLGCPIEKFMLMQFFLFLLNKTQNR